MPPLKLNDKQIAFIRKNSKKMLGTDIADKIGVSKGIVNRFIRKNGIGPAKEDINLWRAKKMFKPFTPDEDSYIINNISGSSLKQIAKELKRTSAYVGNRARQLGLGNIIEQKVLASRIKFGQSPPNKGKKQHEFMSREAIERTKATRFKKGQLPHNTKEKDGVITIRHDHLDRGGRPYKFIRLSVGNWYPLNQYKWEKKYGKLPLGMCLWFKDGNSLNCTLKNLEVITRAENLKRNRMNYLDMPQELRTASRLLKKLNKKIYGKEQAK